MEVLGERSSENGRKRRERAERVELNQGNWSVDCGPKLLGRRPEAERQSCSLQTTSDGEGLT
nr:hypothetical protein Iba_chr09cCG11610 [Ipomoea batatas]